MPWRRKRNRESKIDLDCPIQVVTSLSYGSHFYLCGTLGWQWSIWLLIHWDFPLSLILYLLMDQKFPHLSNIFLRGHFFSAGDQVLLMVLSLWPFCIPLPQWRVTVLSPPVQPSTISHLSVMPSAALTPLSHVRGHLQALGTAVQMSLGSYSSV